MAVMKSSERLRVMDAYAEQAGEGVLIIAQPPARRRPTIVYKSGAFDRICGASMNALSREHPLRMLRRLHVDSETVSAIRGAVKRCTPLSITVSERDVRLTPVFDEARRCTHWVVVVRKKASTSIALHPAARNPFVESLRYLTFHDVLTGLPKRSLLLQHVASALLEGRPGAVFSVHLERVDALAALGHSSANDVLMQVAQRLKCAVPEGAELAKLESGFALWVPQVWESSHTHRTVDAMLAGLAEPFHVHGERVAVRAHVGIAPAAPGTRNTPEDLLRDAEIAAQSAVRDNARYRRFSKRLHEHSLTRLRVESQLQRALQMQQFVCHFQPIIDLKDNRLGGFEALVRWHDPERGLVPPDLFIPIAEETGDIVRIGELVLEMACREAASWPSVGGALPVVNVNVSGRQFDDEDFAGKVIAALRAADLAPNRLTLEITETALAKDEQAVVHVLETLRDLGVRVSLDDFGIGYSSLGSVRRLPLTSVKIDRSFISNVQGEAKGIADESIVRMTVALASTRNLLVIAEGVETPTQLHAVRELACTHAQGFHIARPLPADSLHPWLNRRAAA